MAFLQLKSFVFIGVNFLRLISVLAICLALSGELVVMIDDIKGYQASKSTYPVPPSVPSPSLRLARRAAFMPYSFETAQPHLRHSIQPANPASPTHRLTRKRQHKREIVITDTLYSIPTSTRSRGKATTTAQSAAGTSTATSASAKEVATDPSVDETGACAYFGSTSVPKAVGGILFSTLSRIFACVVLLFMLVSEMPPPTKHTQRFWNWAFPPFGDDYGVGILGLLQLFIACSMLSHALPPFPTVGGWFLFIVSFLNLLAGIGLGPSIKSLRSIFSPSSHSGHAPSAKYTFSSRPLSTQGAPASGHHSHEESEIPPPAVAHGAKKEKTTGRKIFISAPMQQVAPPTAPPYAYATQ